MLIFISDNGISRSIVHKTIFRLIGRYQKIYSKNKKVSGIPALQSCNQGQNDKLKIQ